MSGGPAEIVKKHFVEDTETSLLDDYDNQM